MLDDSALASLTLPSGLLIASPARHHDARAARSPLRDRHPLPRAPPSPFGGIFPAGGAVEAGSKSLVDDRAIRCGFARSRPERPARGVSRS